MVLPEIALEALALLLLSFTREQQGGFRAASLRLAWKKEHFDF